ncbi:TolB family protein [Nonomuraea sp. NPDC049269]|uniref:TolB family protein n=1 Tax=Nonomuraea sp. NPDC049269 TaxID=3364349 RepID=UPI00371CD90B
MRTENELTDALRSAAEWAPQECDLLAALAVRRHRRHRRRTQVLAAGAVVAILGVGAVGIRGFSSGGGHAAVSAATPTNMTVITTMPPNVALSPPARSKVVDADKLWPGAVFTMPAKNADGWHYRPITSLSATEVLLSAESSFEKAGAFEVYDSATGKSRVVTTVPRTPGLDKYIPQTATTDGQSLAWFAYGEKDGAAVREIWTVPLAGGEPRLLGTFTGKHAQIDAIGVDGDHVYWSELSGGVWSIPLAGGEAARVPDSDGLHLMKWPYAVDVADGPKEHDRNQTKLVDLARGAQTKINVPASARGLRCGPSWCVGRNGQGPLYQGSFVQYLDGTNTIALDGLSDVSTLIQFPILDRFLFDGSTVYDAATGEVAAIGKGSGMFGVGTSSEPSTIIYWDGEPGTFTVLNLAAVPPAQ